MINGHHWFLLAVNQSFSVLPIGGVHIRGPLALQLISFSASSLIIGVKIAAPIIAVTVIVDIVLGIIGRTAPQIHLLIVGMPLKLLVGFSCMSFSLYFLSHYLEILFLSLSRTLVSLVHAMN
jgi:flagellar biosynthetic protein FliR